jgi:hypothetical protein
VKRIKELRDLAIVDLDFEYSKLREALDAGSAPAQFNKKGQRTTNTTISSFKVQVETIQELNRVLAFIKKR